MTPGMKFEERLEFNEGDVGLPGRPGAMSRIQNDSIQYRWM